MNVQEVIDIKNQRKVKYKEVIEKILENVHKRILYYANLKKESCIYKIPPIINDMPLFNIELIVKEVFKKLDSEGYLVNAYQDGTLEICWEEKLVQQKVKVDSYILSSEEQRLRNITKKSKQVDERFNFLANPKKLISNKEKTIEEQLDEQLNKILHDKDKQQSKFKKLLK